MRRPRRTPVFGRRPTTLSTTPGKAHPLDRPGTMSRKRERPLRSWTGVTSKMTVTILVPVGGVAPHVFIHANDAHAFKPGRVVDQQTRPFSQDSSVGSIPVHAQGLGDARHRHMMNNHARQRPAHRHAQELRTRIGRLTHVLTPLVSTLWAPVAAYAHMHDRGTPPAGLVRQAPDHRVTTNALAPAASTPPVLTSKMARQHCTVCLNALTRHLQPQAIQARERAQIRAIEVALGMSRSFRWTVSEPPSSEDLDPYPATTRPTPPTTPTPSHAKSRLLSR